MHRFHWFTCCCHAEGKYVIFELALFAKVQYKTFSSNAIMFFSARMRKGVRTAESEWTSTLRLFNKYLERVLEFAQFEFQSSNSCMCAQMDIDRSIWTVHRSMPWRRPAPRKRACDPVSTCVSKPSMRVHARVELRSSRDQLCR